MRDHEARLASVVNSDGLEMSATALRVELLPCCCLFAIVTWNLNHKERCSFTLLLRVWHKYIWARVTLALGHVEPSPYWSELLIPAPA